MPLPLHLLASALILHPFLQLNHIINYQTCYHIGCIAERCAPLALISSLGYMNGRGGCTASAIMSPMAQLVPSCPPSHFCAKVRELVTFYELIRMVYYITSIRTRA